MDRSLLLVLLVLTPVGASADVLVLRNGVELKGVITEETKTDYTIEVAPRGFTTVEKAQVVEARRATPKENAKIRAEWKAAEEEARRKDDDELAFEDRQHAKGLVKIGDRWLTKEEAEALLRTDWPQGQTLPTRSQVTNITYVVQPAASSGSDQSGNTIFVSPGAISGAPRGLAPGGRINPVASVSMPRTGFNPVMPLGGTSPLWRRRSSDATREMFAPR